MSPSKKNEVEHYGVVGSRKYFVEGVQADPQQGTSIQGTKRSEAHQS